MSKKSILKIIINYISKNADQIHKNCDINKKLGESVIKLTLINVPYCQYLQSRIDIFLN